MSVFGIHLNLQFEFYRMIHNSLDAALDQRQYSMRATNSTGTGFLCNANINCDFHS